MPKQKINSKIENRIKDGLKKYTKILQRQKEAGNTKESETSRVVLRIITDVMGYDPFDDVTSEHRVAGTSCDYAIKDGDVVHKMVEVKKIGQRLNARYLRQVENYANKHGCQWAILTNGQCWEIYKLIVQNGKNKTEKFFEFDLFEINLNDKSTLEMLYTLTKEGRQLSALDAQFQKIKARNPCRVAAVLMHEDVLRKIQRVLKVVADDGISISTEEIVETLNASVIRGDLDCEELKKAKSLVSRKMNRQKKERAKKSVVHKVEIEPSTPVAPPVQAVEATTPAVPPVQASETINVTETPQGTGV